MADDAVRSVDRHTFKSSKLAKHGHLLVRGFATGSTGVDAARLVEFPERAPLLYIDINVFGVRRPHLPGTGTQRCAVSLCCAVLWATSLARNDHSPASSLHSESAFTAPKTSRACWASPRFR